MAEDTSDFSKQESTNTYENARIARSLTEELKDQLGVRSRLNESERESLNLSRKLQRSAQENNVDIGNSGNIQKQINKDIKIQSAIQRELNSLIGDYGTATQQSIQNADRIKNLTSEINELHNQRNKVGKDEQQTIDDKIAQLESQLFSSELLKDTDAQRLALLNQSLKLSEEVIQAREEESSIQKQINRRIGLTGGLVSSLGNAMKKLGVNSSIFNDTVKQAEEDMRDMAEQTVRGKESFSRMQIMARGMVSLLDGLAYTLTDPLTILGAIGDAFLKINEQSVEISRLTGQSAGSFELFNTQAASAADKLEVVTELTKQTGMNAQNIFSDKVMMGAANLKAELGLSAEQAGNLAMSSQVYGKSVNNIRDTTVDTVNQYNAMNKVAVSHGQVLRDIGNVSEGIRASFSGSTEELVESAAAARKLGMNLERLDQVANSLLDFESSIQNELEAQLLTGNQINLAKAREYALNNDLKGLGEEIFQNSTKILEFGRMNRLQQQAQAKALGISRNELAKIAYQRGLANQMSHEELENATGVRSEEMRRLTIQKNFMKVIEKVAASITPILDMVGSILSIPWVPHILLGVAAVRGLSKSFIPFLGGIKKAIMQFDILNAKQALLGKKFKGGQFLPGGGRAKKGGQRAGGLLGKLFGSKANKSITPKTGKSIGGGIKSITGSISKIDTKQLLKGAAAMTLVAGSLYIFGKAVQEFMEVGWGDVGKAIVSMFALTGAVAALGALMSSGVGAVAILAGAGAMVIMASSVYILGKATQELAKGFTQFLPGLLKLGSQSDQLFKVGAGLMSIAAGLGAVSVAGLSAIPALGALTGLAVVAEPLAELGLLENTKKESEKEVTKLLGEIKQEIRKKGNVYLDGDKVGEALTLNTYVSS